MCEKCRAAASSAAQAKANRAVDARAAAEARNAKAAKHDGATKRANASKTAASGSNSSAMESAAGVAPAPASKPAARAMSPAEAARKKADPPAPGTGHVVIPLEMDADGDPSREDVIRLRNVNGSFTRELRASDPMVSRRPRTTLLDYHFADVPFGRYVLEIRLASGWAPVIAGLEVTGDGARVGGKAGSDLYNPEALGTPVHEAERASAAPETPSEIVDFNALHELGATDEHR